MSDPSSQSRRDFFHLGAAAGATVLAAGAASAATAPEASRIAPGVEWAVRGKVLQAPAPDQLEAFQDVLIVVGADGVIVRVEAAETTTVDRYHAAGLLVELTASQYLLPGLIDTHIHAPQWPQTGTALDLPLEKWLYEYTFPLEAKYADVGFARGVYSDLITTLLANGTTTGVYYGSLHLPATKILADLCLAKGQRAFIGKTAMDHPEQCPDNYRDKSAKAAIKETRDFIKYVKAMKGNERKLIEPVITPRFIPSCTDELLEGLGKLARETGCAVQTHCSESTWQHEFVRARMGKSDATALSDLGLMNRRTVLAHGVHVSKSDRNLIRKHGAGISHCPFSNALGSNGVLPVKTLLSEGVHVSLGTDIGGGPESSLFKVIALAPVVSQMREDGVDPDVPLDKRGAPDSRISFVTGFYLATTAGGIALDLPIGLIRPGYRFDAMLIDAAVPDTNLRLYARDNSTDILQKIIWGATRANIKKVWVDGRLVKG